MPPPVTPIVSAVAPTPDPRVGLAPGRWDAAQAAWNVRLVSTTPQVQKFLGVSNSDLAFTGKYAVQGNYNGFQIFDISTPTKPELVITYLCPASQSDVSVYKNLLFVSGESQTGRIDCGIQGVPEPVSKDRLRGIRVFDISDMAAPKYVTNVQTCRGSHTHTVVTDPRDKENVYIYVSGSARVRPADELAGCTDGPIEDPNSARFRLEVIRVPIAAPEKAAIVSSPRIFYGPRPATAAGRAGAWRHAPRWCCSRRRGRCGGGGHRSSGSDHGSCRCRTRGSCPRWQRGRSEPTPLRPESVSRHHRLPGHRPGRWCVRRLRASARHQRRGQPEADRSGGRHQHVLLALRDVQQ